MTTIVRRLEGNQLAFWCPGCQEAHVVPVNRAETGKGWLWNGNEIAPTLSPSISIRSGHYASHFTPDMECWCTYNKQHPDEPSKFQCSVCHTFVTDGKIQFLSDCTHHLSGQTVPLPAWPDHYEVSQ